MRTEFRRIAYIVAAAVLVLAAAEVAMHNWRVSLSLGMLELEDSIMNLRRETQELEAEIAALLSPRRLQEIGTALGLEPMPLESFLLMESGSGPDGGGQQ